MILFIQYTPLFFFSHSAWVIVLSLLVDIFLNVLLSGFIHAETQVGRCYSMNVSVPHKIDMLESLNANVDGVRR